MYIMKTNIYNKTIHQYVEYVMRHKAAVGMVLVIMGFSIVVMDTRLRDFLRSAYMQGWGWLGTYARHEHPSHIAPSVTVARVPRISSSR